MKKIVFVWLGVIALCSVLITNGIAQEDEPNNTPGDPGIVIITSNGSYYGTVDPDTDVDDWWYIASGSTGQLVLTQDFDTETSYIGVRKSDKRDGVYYLEGNAPCTVTMYADKYYAIYVTHKEAGLRKIMNSFLNGDNYQFTISGDNSLPVELASFSAQVTAQGVQLQWATESEVDNLGFMVERLEKEQEQWQQIASFQTNEALKGQGSTSGSTRYTFADTRVQDGITYQYRLADVDIHGKIEYHESIEVTAGKVVTTLPEKFALQPAFPNPFNPGTTIQYNLAEDFEVNLRVIDVTGRIVRTLVSQQQAAGSYNLYWNGKDDKGTPLSSGSYFIKLKAGQNVQTQKVVLQR